MTNLEQIRKDKNFTRRELAEKSNIPMRTILSWERRDRKIELASYSSIIRLAKALEVDAQELFDEDSVVRQ